MNLQSLTSTEIVALFVFFGGLITVGIINSAYANVFKKAADKDAAVSSQQISITFVSGHLLAFFVLPMTIVVAATLGIIGKLDAGVSAILGMIISYIVQKVVIR